MGLVLPRELPPEVYRERERGDGPLWLVVLSTLYLGFPPVRIPLGSSASVGGTTGVVVVSMGTSSALPPLVSPLLE